MLGTGVHSAAISEIRARTAPYAMRVSANRPMQASQGPGRVCTVHCAVHLLMLLEHKCTAPAI